MTRSVRLNLCSSFPLAKAKAVSDHGRERRLRDLRKGRPSAAHSRASWTRGLPNLLRTPWSNACPHKGQVGRARRLRSANSRATTSGKIAIRWALSQHQLRLWLWTYLVTAAVLWNVRTYTKGPRAICRLARHLFASRSDLLTLIITLIDGW